jgi:hypothetical protein
MCLSLVCKPTCTMQVHLPPQVPACIETSSPQINDIADMVVVASCASVDVITKMSLNVFEVC